MKYLIRFSKKGKESMFLLPKDTQSRIGKKLQYFMLAENPFFYAERLINRPNEYKFRVGNYRIIFTTKEVENVLILLVLRVGHRRDIYNKK